MAVEVDWFAQPGASKPDPILVVEEVKRSYGGLAAVDVAHLQVQRAAITALIGPNGAGKTTLFNVLTGFERADHGSWRFDGTELAGTRPHQIARLGMVRTFQLTRSLSSMTVLDNLRVAAPSQRGESFFGGLVRPIWRSQEASVTVRAEELLERFALAPMRDEFAGSLSGGQRKLLELARALMCRPDLLMLDEPMAGVNPALAQSLLDHLRALPAEGLTVLFVEHDMDAVAHVADWAVVMSEGRIIAEGPPRTVTANPQVVDAYLGAHHGAPLMGSADPVIQVG